MMGKFADLYASGFNGNVNVSYIAGDYISIVFGLVVIAISIVLFVINKRKAALHNNQFKLALAIWS